MEQQRLTEIYNDMVKSYSEHHRHYHNLDHVSACLFEFTEAEHLIPHTFEVWLSIWYHDVVYDPKEHNNEERSIEYATKTLKGIFSEDALERVSRLIMATRHDVPMRSDDEKFIADIDLAILGGQRDRFNEYEESIRMEYMWVPEDMFRKGRSEILRRFLERDSIYQTDYFREKYEKVARQNLRHSISLLKKDD